MVTDIVSGENPAGTNSPTGPYFSRHTQTLSLNIASNNVDDLHMVRRIIISNRILQRQDED
jgi:hypothetical protein